MSMLKEGYPASSFPASFPASSHQAIPQPQPQVPLSQASRKLALHLAVDTLRIVAGVASIKVDSSLSGEVVIAANVYYKFLTGETM